MNDSIRIEVGPPDRWRKRLVIANNGAAVHRDSFDTNVAAARRRFIIATANKLGVPAEDMGHLDNAIVERADEADTTLEAHARERRGSGDSDSQATQLVDLALDAEPDLFHTVDSEAFASFRVGEHVETWALRSKGFRMWLQRLFFERTKAAPNASVLHDALGVLEAKALFEGSACDVHTRVATVGERVYIDLANDRWEVIEIDADGFRLVPRPPVKFRRSRGMRALPRPAAEGDTSELRHFLNVDSFEDFMLVASWPVAAMRQTGPFPILALHGEQGSSKSTTCRVLRDLVDPNVAPIRSEPRDVRDLMIATRNSWAIVLDNLSVIKPWLSDALCRLSTGGGFSTRELYTDQDEVIFEAQRPCILNGIEDLASRGDLIDRSIIVYLPQINEVDRRAEDEFWRDFYVARPRILAGLYDAVSHAIRTLPDVHLNNPPRMADFAKWLAAAEPALGWQPGAFAAAYQDNRAAANELAIEQNIVGKPLKDFVRAHEEWEGSANELLNALNERVGESTKRSKSWPKAGHVLSGRIRRLAPNLRKLGVSVDFDRESSLRTIRLEAQAMPSDDNPF